MNSDKEKVTQAIGGESRDQLLTWLSENPKTHHWDAVVVYNRGCANAILMQKYIQKLTADNYLTPIDGTIAGPDGSKLNFFGIQLGIPRLSFENADIEKSKAKVTQAITAGLAILTSEPIGSYKGIHTIMRPNGAAGPTLWMDVELDSTPGGVTDAGSVEIDLSKMKDFDTDLFSDRNSVVNAQEFFRKRFAANPELHTYKLGTLSKTADSTLTPQNFKIRTQTVPGAKVRGAPNYGDGAVVLFITLKGGTDGSMPTAASDFKYLIPNDENGTKYSSAVLLSNKVLFANLLNKHLTNALNMTLTLKTPTDEDGDSGHRYLEITRGEITKADYKYVNQGYFFDYIITASSPLITLPTVGADFLARNGTITFTWNTELISNMNFWNTRGELEDTYYDKDVSFTVRMTLTSTPKVMPENGTIQFEQADITEAQIEISSGEEFLQNTSKFHDDLRQIFIDKLFAFTKLITLPDIDTFLLRNLLFPDDNAMVLTDAYAPGDLAAFGNVDPSLTSFTISPEHPILLFEGTRKFTTVPPATNVTWSVRALPGDSDPCGQFDDTGVYTAPSADDLHGRDGQQVIVTATGTAARGAAASSSTVVSIVHQSISVNPMFCVSAPGASQAFTAGTTGESQLTWAMKDPGQEGALEPKTGLSSTYTAAQPPNNAFFVLDVVEVKDTNNNLGQGEVLVINGILGGQVTVDMKDAAQHKVQLQFEISYDEGPIAVPHEYLHWTLLAGTGWVDDENGVYHAPEQELPGFALITCLFESPPVFPGAPTTKHYGYTVLPLPLTAYPDMARAYS